MPALSTRLDRCLTGLTLICILGLAAGPALAQASSWTCDRTGHLQGHAVSPLTLTLPVDAQPASQVWALLAYEDTPLTLPVQLLTAGQGVLFLPLTLEPDQSETVGLTLVGVDSDGLATWGCTGLSLTVLPPPPAPGGRFRMASRVEALAEEADRITGHPSRPHEMPVPGGDGLRALAQDLRDLTAEPQFLAHLDAVLGAYAEAMPALPDLSHPRRAPLALPSGQSKFFPATLAQTDPGTYLQVCPATPEQLTEYIDLGVRARINSDASQQFLLTTGLALAGMSARLVNRAYGGPAQLNTVIDATVTSASTTQAVLSDYLAGMMPLNLDRLEVSHDPVAIPDDTPPDSRVFSIHQVTLHTRSDGWSPDKAALDMMLAVATARTGGAAGQTRRLPGQLRGQADDLLAQTRLGQAHGLDLRLAQRDVDLAEHASRMANRSADALAQLQRRGELPDPALLSTARQHASRTEEALHAAYVRAQPLAEESLLAAESARRAERLRGYADVSENLVTPSLGIVEGQAQSAATSLVASSEVALIGRQVSRCRVDMTRGADGEVPPHLVIRVQEGGADVLSPRLNGVQGARIDFDVVGSGSRTIDVSLNPRVDLFPLTRQVALPRHSIRVRVGQIQGRIDGLPQHLTAGQSYALTAWAGEVPADLITAPRLRWSVEPPLPLTVTDGLWGHAATLTLPDDLTPDTMVTVRVRAEGDFISAAQVEPVWIAVGQLRDNDEDDGPPALCAPDTSARLRRLPAGSLLSARYSSHGHSQAGAVAMQPCGYVSSEFHAAPVGAGLDVGRNPEGIVAWGGEPVYRLDGIDTIEAMFAARGVCPPATPWGTLRDWLAPAGTAVETYLLGSCNTYLFLTPTRAMILERPFYDSPRREDWLFTFYLRD